MFLVKIPTKISQKNNFEIDWDFAQREYMAKLDELNKLQE
jgi:hypothetical protein